MKTDRRRDIKFHVEMVDPVQSPEPCEAMAQYMLKPDRQIEHHERSENLERPAKFQDIPEAKALLGGPGRYADYRYRNTKTKDHCIQQTQANIIGHAYTSMLRAILPGKQALSHNQKQKPADQESRAK